MARLTYLERRSATYYARMEIPEELVPHFGTTTRKKSLRTKDEAEAKRRLGPLIEAWRAEFDDMRTRRTLTADDKADAVWEHYTNALHRDETERQRRPTQADLDAATQAMFERAGREKLDTSDPLAVLDATLDVQVLQKAGALASESRAAKLDHMRKHLAKGETALVEHELSAYLDKHRLIADPASGDARDLARQMMRSEIEALERGMERDRGDYSGVPADPIVKPFSGAVRETAKAGETIMELFDAFERENPNAVQKDRLDQSRRDVGLFLDLIGRNAPAHRIDKVAVRDWKRLLLKFPVKATEMSVFAGLNLAQIVRKNEEVGKPVITTRTVNRYLASLSAFSEWLVANAYIPANPCNKMFLAKEKKQTTLPFTTAQLNTLFASPLFAGCKSADEWRNVAKPGEITIRDHRFWLPLLMLYSGARPAELAQLLTSDIREQGGVWFLHITTEGDGDKSVKTAGSMRVVPIHSELIRLGFLKHHAAMVRAEEPRLFPEAKRNSRGQMIAEFSREFGRYLERIGMKEGRGLSLYSFRHGATDAWRRAGYLDDTFGFMLGHTKGTMTGRYGILPQGALQQRMELIEAIAYPGLVLDHLLPPA